MRLNRYELLKKFPRLEEIVPEFMSLNIGRRKSESNSLRKIKTDEKEFESIT